MCYLQLGFEFSNVRISPFFETGEEVKQWFDTYLIGSKLYSNCVIVSPEN